MRILILFLIVVNGLYCQISLDENFKNINGTIIIFNKEADSSIIFNNKRASTRFSPFSTFKIPNSIIAIETSIIPNINQIITWDHQKYPEEDWWPKTWNDEHNLKSAFKYSVVPIYRHIATMVGIEKMKSYIDAFNYGNKDISSGIDNFWLDGSLKISAVEQIDFLKKFYNNQLSISSRTKNLVKTILVQEQTENYTISAKTGGGYIDQERKIALGWYVGFIEKAENVYFFALNIEGRSFNEIMEPRKEITYSIFKKLGIIQ